MPSLLKPYSEAQYAVRELVCAVLAVIAFAWLVVAFSTGLRAVKITSLAAVFAGATFGCYQSRHTERGLWMLALPCGIGISAFYTFTVVMEVRDAFKVRIPPPWWLVLDVALAGPLVTSAARASWTVFLQNFAYSRQK